MLKDINEDINVNNGNKIKKCPKLEKIEECEEKEVSKSQIETIEMFLRMIKDYGYVVFSKD